MRYLLHNSGEVKYVEIPENTFILGSEEEATDIAAFCFENMTSRLLLSGGNLDDRFFDLKTGLAGAIMQKFSNYQITFAAVIPGEKITGRFGEMVLEANKGRQFRFTNSRDEAIRWISG
ncbi:MAG TPA: DUF4180 domain-containing protein [Bacteroidales bacterium]|nr:DUF4180 domain-containing protein [Bacteroidales bacterium]